jgi:hypothetical protein
MKPRSLSALYKSSNQRSVQHINPSIITTYHQSFQHIHILKMRYAFAQVAFGLGANALVYVTPAYICM